MARNSIGMLDIPNRMKRVGSTPTPAIQLYRSNMSSLEDTLSQSILLWNQHPISLRIGTFNSNDCLFILNNDSLIRYKILVQERHTTPFNWLTKDRLLAWCNPNNPSIILTSQILDDRTIYKLSFPIGYFEVSYPLS